VSFPRNAEDINHARQLLRAAGCSAAIMAKIERAEALEFIDEILEASDAIMVARGDLGVEIGDPELPAVQKMLIEKTRLANKVVLTATQMMESMITNPTPTRAEVFDVANAVIDGTDAVMLSAETASGAYPARAIEAMSRICLSAEKSKDVQRSRHRIDTEFKHIDEAIGMATMYTANHLRVKAIAAMTESGSTPLWMSRISSGIPIYALTQHKKTRHLVTLYRGVCPIPFKPIQEDMNYAIRDIISLLVNEGVITGPEDRIIITRGNLMGVGGGTSTMIIIRVGDWMLEKVTETKS
ncbi:MAG TPA: pyruvate kinase, partial [Gammaproteobacteria bacterium]|nr:pyruvate kinase [Gammaproteobacteria bacterium]